ncbi:hypothetical protein Ae201684P_013145 [Aphanomyces euteiches]|nr:hypothetical protein Ae201684P_013145 [Aphanomyces euteiches]
MAGIESSRLAMGASCVWHVGLASNRCRQLKSGSSMSTIVNFDTYTGHTRIPCDQLNREVLIPSTSLVSIRGILHQEEPLFILCQWRRSSYE